MITLYNPKNLVCQIKTELKLNCPQKPSDEIICQSQHVTWLLSVGVLSRRLFVLECFVFHLMPPSPGSTMAPQIKD